ncbi:MAG TPA: methyltransferase domain-containing protein [Bacteroidales bacterium]|nr:methyltransferase domain-containing protein [Bacteroidales bacterium]
METNKLELVKSQQWFYEFVLPDGSKTDSYLADFVRPVHYTREKALLQFLHEYRENRPMGKALDVSCHEGYFTVLLSGYFENVTGIDKNYESLEKAKLITDVTGAKNIDYIHTSLEEWKQTSPADFVLCFGLLYHIENPVEVFRKLAGLTAKAICIESQVLPCTVQMQVEDGCYKKQRDIRGMFGLCMDYPSLTEGGLSDLALVPSRDALVTLLEYFGFTNIRFYHPEENDYEQFVRGHRVVIYAEKT